MRKLAHLARCDHAAAGAEFALVAPLMVLLILGTVDVGRYMWEVNKTEKATQFGARFAVVTNPVSTGLVQADFESADLAAGDLIPADAIGAVTCTSTSCTCTGCTVSVGGGVDAAAFNAIVARMQVIDPSIAATNVQVTYRGSGFGFAGDPPSGTERMEISPLVTVSLTGKTFAPMSLLLAGQVALPSASTTLPAEDASGQFSN